MDVIINIQTGIIAALFLYSIIITLLYRNKCAEVRGMEIIFSSFSPQLFAEEQQAQSQTEEVFYEETNSSESDLIDTVEVEYISEDK